MKGVKSDNQEGEQLALPPSLISLRVPLCVFFEQHECLVGRPFDPCVVPHDFGRVAREAGLENVRFHDLGHIFVSLALLRGAKPKVISEALGHSSVAFTMDTYSHIISGMQEEMMALLDEVIPAGVGRKAEKEVSIS